ncbi:MAG: hypothetical protein OXG62_10140 [Nitrospinae bacterium]|nr:hypothetical protein [Nitrospinota bacterium]
MVKQKNPWEAPGWHSIGREASLVRHLIGSGVTSLGKANYADKEGEYYTAFFGLSIGLERLAKLILVADFTILNDGQMPAEEVVRNFGHKLVLLLDTVNEISINHNLVLEYTRPNSEISNVIVECLDAFADASRGRYANFASLGDPNLGPEEPIRKWWGDVVELILAEHYYGKPVQERVEGNATIIDSLMSSVSTVFYFDEEGDAIKDVYSASVRTGQTEIVQCFSRFYALMVVRWLSDVFSQLSQKACGEHNVEAFFGVYEYFNTYRVADNFLKTRKIWPLK